MELQAGEFSSASEPRPRTQTPDTPRPEPEGQLSASFPALRFPRPQGSVHLANWISNSTPDIMQPSNMSDTSSLADSAYEIIQGADGEDQDDRLTESTCSLSATRPDDVHSLDGSAEHYDTDSEGEPVHSSNASSIRYTDQALQNPSAQVSAATNLEYGSSSEGSGVVVRSIEFQETDGDDALLAHEISAKHVTHELTADESADIAHGLALPEIPERLVTSIRQTMSHSYLSTQEPLRLLYVGQLEAQRIIVLKVCSAIWVSPKNGSHDQDHFSRHRDGVYNIVPISSFGPDPELDLMEASRYQIKVEHCTSADELLDEEEILDPEYRITIDQDKSYHSSFYKSRPVVEPRWEPPHIAVFFCSERDDADAERTRDAAHSFMKRHGVPSIFVAAQQNFCRYARMGQLIDEHTPHLCLESRDPERPMTARRFPIDLDSFAEIDARQMNRNLAYLTGLTESEDGELERGTAADEKAISRRTPSENSNQASITPENGWDPERLLRWVFNTVIQNLLFAIGTLLILNFVAWMVPGPRVHELNPASSTNVCSLTPTYPAGFTMSKSSSVVTSTKTVVVNVTSTRTVQVSQTKPSTSTLASALSLAGLLTGGPSVVPTVSEAKKPVDTSKKTVCSVQVHSPTELLVAIPSRNKAVWLAHGAIDIAVRRSEDLIKTKISSVDEGVLVELARKDAHGMLNVTVLTTRRPKINETFQVDFRNMPVTEALEAGLRMLQDALNKLPWSEDATHLLRDARKLPREVASALEHASEAVREHTTDTVKRTTDKVREHLAQRFKLAEAMGNHVDLQVLQAQIASRLWWLKMQGGVEEHDEYERHASRLLKMKHEQLVRRQEGRGKAPPKGAKKPCGSRRGLYNPFKKHCAKRAGDDGAKDPRSGDGVRRSPWKKLMGGM